LNKRGGMRELVLIDFLTTGLSPNQSERPEKAVDAAQAII